MVRYLVLFSVAIIIILLFTGFSFSFDYSSRIVRLPKQKKVQIKISWKERDSQILHDSVCYNYPEGDIIYRNCRQEARELFRARCDKYEDLYHKTRNPYNRDYKRGMDKYCKSAVTYWP